MIQSRATPWRHRARARSASLPFEVLDPHI
jgi:hypothetical protein